MPDPKYTWLMAPEVVDNLISDKEGAALSAKQGKILREMIQSGGGGSGGTITDEYYRGAYNTSVELIAAHATDAAGAYAIVIETGTMWIWNTNDSTWKDTNIAPIGSKGPTGDKGPIGDKGPRGDKGPTGDPGPGGGGSAVTVIDDLSSSSTTSALSANMGRTLKNSLDTKIGVTDIIDALDSIATNRPLSANMGKSLATSISNKQDIIDSDIMGALTGNDSISATNPVASLFNSATAIKGDPNKIFKNPTKDQWGFRSVSFGTSDPDAVTNENGKTPVFTNYNYNSGATKWNVLTFGTDNQITQIAMQILSDPGKPGADSIFFRNRTNTTDADMSIGWDPWRELNSLSSAGGLGTVIDMTDTATFATSSMKVNSTAEVVVLKGLGIYRYDELSTDDPDGECVIATVSGTGRYILLIPSIEYTRAMIHEETGARFSLIDEKIGALIDEINVNFANSSLKRVEFDYTCAAGSITTNYNFLLYNITSDIERALGTAIDNVKIVSINAIPKVKLAVPSSIYTSCHYYIERNGTDKQIQLVRMYMTGGTITSATLVSTPVTIEIFYLEGGINDR